MSDICLTAAMRDIKESYPLALMLGIDESTYETIQSFYGNNHELIICHVLRMWLAANPEDPVKQIESALQFIGEDEISQVLSQLTSLGNGNFNVPKISILYYQSSLFRSVLF